jgi:hypothetical protein
MIKDHHTEYAYNLKETMIGPEIIATTRSNEENFILIV